MALPGNTVSSSPVPSPFLLPDGRALDNPLEDYERGGIALQDPSQGLNVRTWRAFVTDEGIWLQSRQGALPLFYIPGEEINLVSLAFDNNMNPVICYRQLEVVKLNWYDTTVNSRVTTQYPDALTGAVTLDDKRPTQDAVNDVLFFYVKDEGVYYRQQRDRFGVERRLAPIPQEFSNVVPAYCEEDYCSTDYTGMSVNGFASAIHIKVGMATNYRVQIEMAI